MKRRLLMLAFAVSAGSAALSPPAAAQPAPPAVELISHGRFNDVTLLRPSVPTQQFVILLSGADGWNATMDALAQSLVSRGAMVAGVDSPRLFKALEADGNRCVFPDGDFENLAHHLEAYAQLPGYRPPLLAGVGAGGALAYAVLAQAQAASFGGGFSLGFCPKLALRKPLCKGDGVHWKRLADGTGVTLLPAAQMPVPWLANADASPSASACEAGAAHGFVSRIAGAQWLDTDLAQSSATAYKRLAARSSAPLAAPPASLADLPIIEVPAAATAAAAASSERFVVLLSGDGGWAGIDKELAAAFARRGLPVAGFDSLRYFWSARTPDGLAGDLDRVIRYYATQWRRREVLLVGYSQGADVLPFAINRLPAATGERIALTVLLGPGQKAAFEFHVSNWLGPSGDEPIAPEAKRLRADKTVCIYGSSEADSLCPELSANHARALALPGGHHFGGDYEQLAALILAQIPAPAAR